MEQINKKYVLNLIKLSEKNNSKMEVSKITDAHIVIKLDLYIDNQDEGREDMTKKDFENFINHIDARFDSLDKRLTNVENRLTNVESDVKAIKTCPTIQKELNSFK